MNRSKKLAIQVFNRQRKLSVERSVLQEYLESVAAVLDLDMGFSVVLISDAAMRKYNRRFAGKDKATDVLSFPTDADERALDPNLGDILISVETAERQRKDSLEQELKVLILHGVLHLLGFDHEADQGEMTAKEGVLRRKLGLL